jgi:hypothetical protein
MRAMVERQHRKGESIRQSAACQTSPCSATASTERHAGSGLPFVSSPILIQARYTKRKLV